MSLMSLSGYTPYVKKHTKWKSSKKIGELAEYIQESNPFSHTYILPDAGDFKWEIPVPYNNKLNRKEIGVLQESELIPLNLHIYPEKNIGIWEQMKTGNKVKYERKDFNISIIKNIMCDLYNQTESVYIKDPIRTLLI